MEEGKTVSSSVTSSSQETRSVQFSEEVGRKAADQETESGCDRCSQDKYPCECKKEEEERCCVCGSTESVQRCSGCRAAKYCSKKCQKSHHEYHSGYCSAISQLEKLEKEKIYGSFSVREKQLDFLKQAKIACFKDCKTCWTETDIEVSIERKNIGDIVGHRFNDKLGGSIMVGRKSSRGESVSCVGVPEW